MLIRTNINLFKRGNLADANKLRKELKSQIRKAARAYYKNKIKNLCHGKPKNWYSEIKNLPARVKNN